MSNNQIDFFLYQEPSLLFKLMLKIGLLGTIDLNQFIFNPGITTLKPENITCLSINTLSFESLANSNDVLNANLLKIIKCHSNLNLIFDLSIAHLLGTENDSRILVKFCELLKQNSIDPKRIALLFGNSNAPAIYKSWQEKNNIIDFAITVLGYNYQLYKTGGIQWVNAAKEEINKIFGTLGKLDHFVPMHEFSHFKMIGMNVRDWPPPRIKPLVYFIELSSLCNAACIFCHYPQLRDKGKPTTIAQDVMIENTCALVDADVIERGLSDIGISITPTTGDVLINKNWAKLAHEFLLKPYIGWVDIVTNGILLNEKNIDALCELPNLDKLNFSISTGGTDRDTYKFMFGTDMFNKVVKNVNLLFEKLKQRDIKLFATVRLRVPDKKVISEEEVVRIYNPCGYMWAIYEILDTYKDVPEDVPGKQHLKIYNELLPRDNNPCGMLKIGAMNFGAEGNITACGCHYSQMPNDKSLVLGTVHSQLSELTAKRQELLSAWQRNNKIPVPCQTCQHYHQHNHIEQMNVLLKQRPVSATHVEEDNSVAMRQQLIETVFHNVEVGNINFYQLKHQNYNGYFRLLKDYYGLKNSSFTTQNNEFYIIQGDINYLGDEERLLGQYHIDKLGIKNIIIDVSTEAINLQLSNQFYLLQLSRLALILSQRKYQSFKFYLIHANTSKIDLTTQLAKSNIYFTNLEFVSIDFYLYRFNLDIKKSLSSNVYNNYLENKSTKNKHFICLNHRPRWHRYAVMLSILANGHLEKGYCSFAGEQQGRICAETIDDLNSMKQNVTQLNNGEHLLNQLDKLHAMSPIVLDKPPLTIQNELWGKDGTGHLGQPLGLDKTNNDINDKFLSSYFEIVTETYFTDENCSYITEKMLRPIFSMRPFICIGTPHSLSKLKYYGFKTFSPYIDEEYDSIVDPICRMNAILLEVNRLCALNIKQISEIYTNLQDILLYNRQHYLENFDSVMNNEIIALKFKEQKNVQAETIF